MCHALPFLCPVCCPVYVTGVGSQQLPSDGAAVLRCMADVLDWLQAAAAAQPGIQLQVLVTGSLYLVGDCLAGLHEQPK